MDGGRRGPFSLNDEAQVALREIGIRDIGFVVFVVIDSQEAIYQRSLWMHTDGGAYGWMGHGWIDGSMPREVVISEESREATAVFRVSMPVLLFKMKSMGTAHMSRPNAPTNTTGAARNTIFTAHARPGRFTCVCGDDVACPSRVLEICGILEQMRAFEKRCFVALKGEERKGVIVFL